MLRVVALVFAAAALVSFGSLAAAPALSIERMAMHQFEDGPVLESSYEFLPGETAHFSCRLTGYGIQKKDDENQQAKLSWHVDVADPNGIALDKPKSGVIEARVLPEDKNWLPKFLYEFTVPPFAASGNYRVSVRVKDEISGAEVHADLNFHVRGHDVDPSDTLVIRNFHFFRAENETVPMRDSVYHPGEMLWAKFDAVGFKLGEGNHFDVAYGLTVEDASGKQLFAQPEAAQESHESFYPQRYVPGALSLSLDKNVPAATYALVVTVHDKVGGQTWEERRMFEVK